MPENGEIIFNDNEVMTFSNDATSPEEAQYCDANRKGRKPNPGNYMPDHDQLFSSCVSEYEMVKGPEWQSWWNPKTWTVTAGMVPLLHIEMVPSETDIVQFSERQDF